MQQLSSRVLAPAELRGGGRASVRAVARAPVTIKAFVSEPKNGLEYVKTLPGITPPTGFFDPWDFTKSPCVAAPALRCAADWRRALGPFPCSALFSGETLAGAAQGPARRADWPAAIPRAAGPSLSPRRSASASRRCGLAVLKGFSCFLDPALPLLSAAGQPDAQRIRAALLAPAAADHPRPRGHARRRRLGRPGAGEPECPPSPCCVTSSPCWSTPRSR